MAFPETRLDRERLSYTPAPHEGAQKTIAVTAPLMKVHQINPLTQIIGKTLVHGASTSAAVWQLALVQTVDGITTTEYANSGAYTNTWAARLTAFSGLFVNSYSVYFDGVGDYIDLGANYNYERTQAFTISAWTKRLGSAASESVIFGKQGSSNTAGFRLSWTSSYYEFDLCNGGTNRIEVRTPATFPLGTWHHVVATYDGTSLASGCKVYVDNVSQTLTVSANTLTASILTAVHAQIGARNGAVNEYVGVLDQMSIWDISLSAGEVAEVWNSGYPKDLNLHSRVANLKGWWPLGEGDKDTWPTINDNSTANVDGTATNMFISAINVDVKP